MRNSPAGGGAYNTGRQSGSGRHFAFFRVVVVQQVVERPSDGEHPVIRAGRLD